MIRHMSVVFVVLATSAFAVAQQWEKGSGENLVANASFERAEDGQPLRWDARGPVYSSDEAVARSGERSLKFVNHNPDDYVLCGQDIDLQKGHRYEVKVWVRTEDVEGDDSGVTVCLEWWDDQGEYIGGCYPQGEKGDTTEWTEVVGTSRRIPENAVRCNVTCYVRKGMTGTAWWDDVSVRRVRERPLKKTVLMWPSYRGWITHGGSSYVQVRARFEFADMPGGADSVRLTAKVTPAGSDEVIAQHEIEQLTDDPMDVQFRLPDLQPGEYVLRVGLVDKTTGNLLCEDTHRLERRTGPEPKCYIDRHNRVILDGEPFFPLGMYWGGVTQEHLKIYADSAFNCLMPYGRPNQEQMDMIHEFGLKAIYSIKDFYYGTKWCPDFIESEKDEERVVRERVRKYRDHPALLAWYLNDERPVSMLPRLQAHQQWVEQEDPNHPTWVVLYQVGQVAKYLKTFDAIGTDPYPVPSRPVSMAGNWARRTRIAVADARSIWMVPQVHNWGVYRDDPEGKIRPPTYEEMRCMTWQCICEGADGLIYYSWMDLHRDPAMPFERRWPEVKRVAEEVAAYIPVLLSAERAPWPEVDGPDCIHWTVRKRDGTVYLFVVNDSSEAATATFRFAQGPEEVLANDQQVASGQRGALEVTLDALAVEFYEVRL